MQIFAFKSADDDKNDNVVRAVDISPADAVKTLSYDDLKILMETLDKDTTRMSTNATHLAGKRCPWVGIGQ